ncbi:MAG TPA: hypothetical protein ENH91_00125 [Leeuwenhoekiella sp.]|nr:hypothetical protein [Leeuwenhoekiella sp.]
MEHTHVIYENAFGIAFYLPTPNTSNLDAQVVFRDLGFYLSLDELKQFSYQAVESLSKKQCADCPHQDNCRSLLVRTPSSKMDMAISKNELYLLRELLDHTILRLEAQNYMTFALN